MRSSTVLAQPALRKKRCERTSRARLTSERDLAHLPQSTLTIYHLSKMLDSWTDFGDEAEELSKKIADLIKLQVKEKLNIPRFKVVVQVNIGQKKDQGVLVTSRCLWSSLDNYATASYQDEKIWATAITFALYTE